MADASLAEQALASGLVQPDQTTCGSSVLVVARMYNDPSYASFMLHGLNVVSGVEVAGTVRDRFKLQTLAMHRLTSGFKDSGGGFQIPWPTSLGTQPWALAREMTNEAGARGKKYVVRATLPGQRPSTFSTVASAARAGLVVPLYVGNRWSPRHVVLVIPSEDTSPSRVVIYDPASGRRYPIDATAFTGGTLDVAGWDVPWAAIVPV